MFCKSIANPVHFLNLYVMATVSFYLDTRRIKKDGTFPIKLYVNNRGCFFVSTEFSAKKDEWSGTEYNKNCPNYKARNIAIRNLMNKVESYILGMEGKVLSFPDENLKVSIKRLISGELDSKRFVDYIEEFAQTKSNPNTKELYLLTARKLQEYDCNCTFETMDRAWLSNFERWMQESGMKVNALAIHLRNIRAVFNYCLDEEYTTLYPFRRFSIKKEETRKRSLTVEQLRTLRDYQCEDYQVRYRDMFMLMFYLIGINAADLFLAKKSDLVNGRLEYKRAKTGKLYSVLVLPEAMDIIEKYKGAGDYLLNVMDEYKNYKDFLHRMGNALKEIGPMERRGRGGKKVRTPLFPDISSYWSRHTWATLAAFLDIPKEVISAGLGHEIGSSVTSIYIDFNLWKVDDANRKVIDYV